MIADADALAEVTAAFAAGSAVAVDAERASGYRYGQRAYLVQLRRAGAGTALIDPVACPDLSGLGAAIADAEWVLHAATQDLPCLREIGMVPTRIFIPATEKALAQAGLSIDDIGLFEINEAFAVQVLAFLEHYGIADDDARVNQYGGAIAFGHPLASSGVRLMTQLARQFEEQPNVRYGLTTMCVGFGMGATVIWENPHFEGDK
ncbi:3-ketoacyl-CoA thiolase [Streptomyces tendae]